jgi:16S rRNA (guanine966-N2)-methyltransferase
VLSRRTRALARLRVVAGTAGGLRLVAPPGTVTRPTSDRVKEAMFSALEAHRGPLAGASVLDLYAGSGALAIEALSRGADRAVLVERDPRALDAIADNLEHTRLAARARVHRGDAVAFLGGLVPPEAPFDVVCCDPPYDLDAGVLSRVLALATAEGWLADGARLVIERAAAHPPILPSGWHSGWQRGFGDTLVVFAHREEGPTE